MTEMLSDFRARVHAKRIAAQTRRLKRAAKAAVLWPKPAQASRSLPAKLRPATLTPRKRLRAKLDALWSIFIRKRDFRLHGGVCRICGIRPIQVAYHIVPRGDDATRWLPENGCGACSPCNYWELRNRGRRVRDRHIALFGLDNIEALEAKSRTTANFELEDLERMLEDFKRRIGATT